MSEQKGPVHIAIIMDGNGRWAQKLGKPRSFGHREGLETAKKITLAASNAGIKFLSLYVFSTENWKRTETEVSFLMQLLKSHLRREYDFYKENQIRVIHSGDLERLPAEVKKEISSVTADTASFKGLTVNLAINYGGRDELIRAVNRWIEDDDTQKAPLDTDTIRKYLDQPDIPDPDLVIRTAGEKRLSNFLLWETAYSEFYFSDKYWPEWKEKDLADAIESYIKRDRKFGALSKEKQE